MFILTLSWQIFPQVSCPVVSKLTCSCLYKGRPGDTLDGSMDSWSWIKCYWCKLKKATCLEPQPGRSEQDPGDSKVIRVEDLSARKKFCPLGHCFLHSKGCWQRWINIMTNELLNTEVGKGWTYSFTDCSLGFAAVTSHHCISLSFNLLLQLKGTWGSAFMDSEWLQREEIFIK